MIVGFLQVIYFRYEYMRMRVYLCKNKHTHVFTLCQCPVSYTHLDVYKRQHLNLLKSQAEILASRLKGLNLYSRILK